jgi:hypothetical protein
VKRAAISLPLAIFVLAGCPECPTPPLGTGGTGGSGSGGGGDATSTTSHVSATASTSSSSGGADAGMVCEDHNECTEEIVDSSGNCSHLLRPVGTPCSVGACADGNCCALCISYDLKNNTFACDGCGFDQVCLNGMCSKECGVDSECDDGNLCTSFACVMGHCRRAPLPDGNLCGMSPAMFCTGGLCR